MHLDVKVHIIIIIIPNIPTKKYQYALNTFNSRDKYFNSSN